jgi:hypothetical protein
MASIVFRNARLIDGVAAQPRDGVSIVVEGERISTVGGADVPARGDATVIDLKGQTVLPGLIDTHVHTTMMDEECLPLFLAAGVTTARDVGGKLEHLVSPIAETVTRPIPEPPPATSAIFPCSSPAMTEPPRGRPFPTNFSLATNTRVRTAHCANTLYEHPESADSLDSALGLG